LLSRLGDLVQHFIPKDELRVKMHKFVKSSETYLGSRFDKCEEVARPRLIGRVSILGDDPLTSAKPVLPLSLHKLI
jgi:hypothetical protein